MAKLTFYLGYTQDPAPAAQVNPVYGPLKIKYTKESGEAFFRQELDGKLKFIGKDFGIIMARPFDTVYYLRIHALEESPAKGAAPEEQDILARFTRIDCEIDLDNKIIEVKPEILDGYSGIMGALEKEYDLLTAGIVAEPVSMYRRPVLQCYIIGEKTISSYINGVYWDNECEVPTDLDDFKLKRGFVIKRLDPFSYMWYDTGAEERIQSNAQEFSAVEVDGYRYSEDRRFRVKYDTSAGSGRYVLSYLLANGSWYPEDVEPSGKTESGARYYRILNSAVAPGTWIYVFAQIYVVRNLAFRLLCDNKADCTIYGEDSGTVFDGALIKNDSSFGNTMNYRYAVRIDPDSYGFMPVLNIRCSAEEGIYGQRQPGQFYRYPLIPASAGLSAAWPISKNTWGDFSTWLIYQQSADFIDKKFRQPVTVKHTYSLGNCIRALLRKAELDLTFEDTPEYSWFLYSGNGSYTGGNSLYLSPKSNVIEGNYDRPAQKMPMTLKGIFDMLKNCFKCYWFVEGGRLRIEHVSFFSCGGTYSEPGQAAHTVDLTAKTDPRLRKPWSFDKSRYEFDSADMPERLQFGWMDDSSEPFDGYPLEVVSNYAKKGQVDEVVVDGFSSDVDMMMSAPGDFSKDGAALLAVNSEGRVPYFGVTIRTVDYLPNGSSYDIEGEYLVQNGFLGFANLVPLYYISDLPASHIRLNGADYTSGEDLTASMVSYMAKRIKSQKLKCPLGLTLDTLKLYKTGMGAGQLDSASYDLSSEVAELTILHDTEN